MSLLTVDDVETIAVLGAGNMGHGIAEVAALAGYSVRLRDVKDEFVQNGYDQIAWSLEKLAESGELTETEVEETLSRIEPLVALDTTLADVDVVVEVVPEKMDLKKEVYAEVEANAPEHAVFTTNTSTLSVTELSEATDRPERFCGTHFFNPPVHMPLVEVISGEHTSDETLTFAEELVESFEKTPIRVRKDVPGFVVNRVLVPLLNEATWIVEREEGTIAEVDSTASARLGLPMGCFELCDQIGIDVALDVLDYMHETLGEGYAPSPLLEAKVDAGTFGKKTGQGFYDWDDGGAEIPDDAGTDSIEERLVGVGINELSKLVAADVAPATEIDTAMQLGAGFPRGVTAMASDLGYERIHQRLLELQEETGAVRYEPTSLLAEWAETGGPER